MTMTSRAKIFLSRLNVPIGAGLACVYVRVNRKAPTIRNFSSIALANRSRARWPRTDRDRF